MNPSRPSRIPLVFAWIVLLLASALPRVVVQEVFQRSVSADQGVVFSLAVLLPALLIAILVKSLRPVLPFLALMLVLVGGQWLVYNRIDTLGSYPAWLGNPSFNFYMLAEQSLNLMVSLLMIAALLLMGRRPRDFFLLPGDLSAPAGAVRWLGVREGTPWNKFAAWLTVCISAGTLAFLLLAGSLSLDTLRALPPFIPAILLAAALNAFTEELTYKASFLSVLEGPLGGRQAVLMVAVYFGIGHYYGVPYGVIGVLLAGFLGWLLAKSMRETRGMFWAWFIHFWQDVLIFSFLVLGSIVPGGG